MIRTMCLPATAALATILACLGAPLGVTTTSRAAASEWISFRPAQVAGNGPDQTAYLADGFFARVMGVGSTQGADSVSRAPYQPPVAPSPAVRRGGRSEFFFDSSGYAAHEHTFMPIAHLPVIQAPIHRDVAARIGWWDVSHRGAIIKVGEYQDLRPSLFWDVDQLRSDGVRTLDFFGTGLDNESTHAGLYFFSPDYQAKVRYDRFLHRLDHDPLANMAPPTSSEGIVGEDLNVGEDYAVRIQDIRTSFRGKLAKDVKYQLNLWLRRKKGERQALGAQHGAPGVTDCRVCHVENQRQTIDWTTVSLEPVIETHFGPVKAQYSRPMRSFSQDDGIVLRTYGGFHGYDYAGDFPYAVVPDTLSQTDRLRLSTDLPGCTSLYSSLHRGDTRNKVRDTRRDYYGYDIRLTNRYFRKLTLNGFVRYNRQLNQFPPFLVPPEDEATSVPTAIVPPYGLRQPIDYLRMSTGADASWRPFRNRRIAINFGGEYGVIRRSYADYNVQIPPTVVQQGSTPYLAYSLGTTTKWHPRFDTYVRYKGRAISPPVFSVDLYTGETNTNQPEQEDLVQIGGTWVAADNLLASASVGIENREHHSEIADFVEDNYPITVTLWYAPSQAWSLSGGYGYFSNWIDQQIYFPSDTPLVQPLDRRKWNYGGRGQLINCGSSYRCSESLSLSGSLQYLWSFNAFDPLEPWPDLTAYSDVIVNTTRYSGGVDWTASDRTSAYVRYVYEDYHDASLALVSGSAQMILGGFTGIY